MTTLHDPLLAFNLLGPMAWLAETWKLKRHLPVKTAVLTTPLMSNHELLFCIVSCRLLLGTLIR